MYIKKNEAFHVGTRQWPSSWLLIQSKGVAIARRTNERPQTNLNLVFWSAFCMRSICVVTFLFSRTTLEGIICISASPADETDSDDPAWNSTSAHKHPFTTQSYFFTWSEKQLCWSHLDVGVHSMLPEDRLLYFPFCFLEQSKVMSFWYWREWMSFLGVLKISVLSTVIACMYDLWFTKKWF